MYKPITSRVQVARSTSLKLTAEELKKKKEKEKNKKGKLGETATGGGSTGGSDKEVEVDVMGEKTDHVEPNESREKDPKKWDKQRKGICNGSIKGDKSKIDCSDVVVDKKKEIVKGEGVDYETDLKQSNQGTSLTFDQTREKKLNNTYVNKRLRNSKIKEAKYKSRVNKDTAKYDLPDKDGKKDGVLSDEEISKMPKGFLGFGNKQKRYIKNKAKQEENQLEKENYASLSANAALDSASGVAQGGKYQKADTDVTKGQRTEAQQIAEAKRLKIKADKEAKAAEDKAATEAAEKEAQKEKEQQTAKVENVTTGQGGRSIGANEAAAITPGAGPGGMADGYNFAPTDYSKILQGNSAFAKKGYKQKAKSVATKKLQEKKH